MRVPRFIGILIAVAGLGWLAFVMPHVPASLFIPVAVLGGASELSLMLWLLIVGMGEGRRPDPA